MNTMENFSVKKIVLIFHFNKIINSQQSRIGKRGPGYPTSFQIIVFIEKNILQSIQLQQCCNYCSCDSHEIIIYFLNLCSMNVVFKKCGFNKHFNAL
jgi:hypothetical protein